MTQRAEMPPAEPAGTFDPPTGQWQPMAPKYATLRRYNTLIGWLVLAVPTTVVTALIWGKAAWFVGSAWLLLIGYRVWRQGAIARSWGYAVRDTDLYIKHGIMWRSLTVVPYGRMQAINVSSGPIERWLGLATVKLVTASAESNASIPGIAPAEADRLRDHLTLLGEQQAAGL